ncbi:hypothetical protein HMPREF9336_04068 [Segniliparus rugosus ATCC BAA-974]|uniref:Uncharacterized protein n=1 Tax=Segniliparus rugosus (strain ATCC BAA-974 / DSM 45345 / CCUG 50838 / CIP 108380 / JCM 13579 / CDC 945) TaxID=679197 RepID=U1M1X6_SEGRC|nr:hypothetical protein HMPREF9336_04068 [Segniliparus rugosus ATCC BAA-974]
MVTVVVWVVVTVVVWVLVLVEVLVTVRSSARDGDGSEWAEAGSPMTASAPAAARQPAERVRGRVSCESAVRSIRPS